MVWLVLAGPAAVVVAGFVTMAIAYRHADVVVRRGAGTRCRAAGRRDRARAAGPQPRGHAAADPPPVPMKRQALRILWPAFLAAGVLEMLVFAVVDPTELRWFGGPLIGWPPLAIYSVTLFIYWVFIAFAGALTALLSLNEDEVNKMGGWRR